MAERPIRLRSTSAADLQWRHVGALAGGALDRSCPRRDASPGQRTTSRTFRHGGRRAGGARTAVGGCRVFWVRDFRTLQVPDNESFATLGQLLGENTQLRVWWHNADDWRVDRIRSTGETDLFRHGWGIVRWVESETATYSPVSKIRLPDASDLLPPTFARSLLQGVRESELSRLPARRYRGHRCARPATDARRKGNDRRPCRYLGRPRSGLALQVELYGVGEQRPYSPRRFVSSGLARRQPQHPLQAGRRRTGQLRAVRRRRRGCERIRAVRSAHFLAAGSTRRRGPRRRRNLRARPHHLDRDTAARPSRRAAAATAPGSRHRAVHRRWDLAPVGPVGLLITPRARGGAFLLAGTVT